MWTKIGIIAAVVGAIGVATGGFIKYHTKFAEAGEVTQVQQQVLQMDINFKGFAISNQIAQVRRRLWEIEGKYQCERGQTNKVAPEVRGEYRRLLAMLKDLERQIRIIEAAKLETEMEKAKKAGGTE